MAGFDSKTTLVSATTFASIFLGGFIWLVASCSPSDSDEYREVAVRRYVEQIIDRQPLTIVTIENGQHRRWEVQRYTTVENFLLENPLCCSISVDGPEGSRLSPFQRRWHQVLGYATATYELTYCQDLNCRSNMIERTLIVDFHGNIVERFED